METAGSGDGGSIRKGAICSEPDGYGMKRVVTQVYFRVMLNLLELGIVSTEPADVYAQDIHTFEERKKAIERDLTTANSNITMFMETLTFLGPDEDPTTNELVQVGFCEIKASVNFPNEAIDIEDPELLGELVKVKESVDNVLQHYWEVVDQRIGKGVAKPPSQQANGEPKTNAIDDLRGLDFAPTAPQAANDAFADESGAGPSSFPPDEPPYVPSEKKLGYVKRHFLAVSLESSIPANHTAPEFPNSETDTTPAQSLLIKPSVLRKFVGKNESAFVDWKRIRVTGGKGGNGAISFFKSALHPVGPPSGGNGGKGGDVYIVASSELTSLNNVSSVYVADHGRSGGSKQQHGPNGKDLEIHLPVGTEVREVEAPISERPPVFEEEYDSDDERRGFAPPKRTPPPLVSSEDQPEWQESDLEKLRQNFKFQSGYVPQDDRVKMLLERIIEEPPPKTEKLSFNLSHHGERHCIVRGGRGGYGNPHFLSSEIRGPAFAGKGTSGPTIYLELELKTIADAGLVGLPNAGKSTFLGAVSNAHPKIAPYPFTTLNPYVGTIDYPDFWRMTIADIPGLIEGAHRNVGLGHRFLRHIERSKMLVYVVDLAEDAPWKDLNVLKRELELYQAGLTNRPSLVVANKADLGIKAKRNLEVMKRQAEKTGDVVVPCSAKEGKNVETVTGVMRQMVEKLRRDEKEAAHVEQEKLAAVFKPPSAAA
ncbi:hypothetical protein HK097_010834 [Rhizophlyctis rosea]|uniref:Obg family GTPase CgtA n=1 Tax=Rhizophlyctis rosea TaxID=64517 RepID=A0AAD5X4Y0_9FUNG|nr:hypothetical protein HK097_010834 [Rhizophlyctis rosea]